jgi:hypothetical protein
MISPIGSQAGEILAKAVSFAADLGLRIRGDGINDQSLLLPNGSRLIARPAVPVSLRGSRRPASSSSMKPPMSSPNPSGPRPILAVGGGALWVISTPPDPSATSPNFGTTRTKPGNGAQSPPPNARLTPEFLAAERRTYGELYVARTYLCQFIAAGLQLLTRSQVKEATVAALPEIHFRLREKTRIYLGLDIGKRQDHAAIAVVELRWAYGAKNNITQKVAEIPTLVLRYATRLALEPKPPAYPNWCARPSSASRPAWASPPGERSAHRLDWQPWPHGGRTDPPEPAEGPRRQAYLPAARRPAAQGWLPQLAPPGPGQ